MKRFYAVLISIILFLVFAFPVSAHPGKTDEQGGHYDWETGEYHFHHGYPAHQHVDGVCPYDYVDKTGQNSGSSSSSDTDTRQEPESFAEKPKEDHTYIHADNSGLSSTDSSLSSGTKQRKTSGYSNFKNVLLVIVLIIAVAPIILLIVNILYCLFSLLFEAIKKLFKNHHEAHPHEPCSPTPLPLPPAPLPVPTESDYKNLVSVLCAVGLQKTKKELTEIKNKERERRETNQKLNNFNLIWALSNMLFYENNKLKREMTDDEYKVNQQIASELFSLVSIPSLIPGFPADISTDDFDQIVFLNHTQERPFSIYTGYRHKTSSKIHLFRQCNGYFYGFFDICCTLGENQNKICKNCLNKYGKEYVTTPQWFVTYEEIRSIKEYYRIDIKKYSTKNVLADES